jgi:hypothetical protein
MSWWSPFPFWWRHIAGLFIFVVPISMPEKRPMKHICVAIVLFFLLIPDSLPAQGFVPAGNTISRDEMTRDLRSLFRTLERHHPRLYMYVDRETYHHSLDSLIGELPVRMKLADFYLLASRTVYELKHGHILLFPGDPGHPRHSCNSLSEYEFMVFGDSLYVAGGEVGECVVKPGTRLVSVNGQQVTEVMKRYRDAVPVEGHSGTLRDRLLSELIPTFLMFESPDNDSLTLLFSHLDSVFTCTVAACEEVESNLGLFEMFTEMQRAVDPPARRDSSGLSTPFARLRFLDDEGRIAILSVKSFMPSNADFYAECFSLLDSMQTRHLIIDLRDNLGGVLLFAGGLYSYLTDSAFRFIEPPVINSWVQLFYPQGASMVQKAFSTLLFPVLLGVYSPIKRIGEKEFSYNAIESRRRQPERLRFQGSISMLVNGGTYSAASTVAANLKYSQNLLTIGQETGGASEGTVAMRLNTTKLKHSGFYLRYGVGFLQPTAKGGQPGHGIVPDVQVLPTLDDLIHGNDPQLNMMLNLLQNRER